MQPETRATILLGITAMLVTISVPAAQAQAVARPREAQVLMQHEAPYLGIGGQDITADRAKALKLKEERGAEVMMVDPDTAAAKAGMEKGDVVLEYNGQKVEGWEELKRLVSETPVGREVKIGVWRNGSLQTLTATMGSRKENSIDLGGRQFNVPAMRIQPMEPPVFSMPEFRTFARNPALGIYGEPLGSEAQLAEYFGVKDGILVRSVSKNSAAEKAGMKAGDVITKIDDSAVSSPADVTSKLRAGTGKRTFTMTVVRNHKEMPLTVTIEPSTVTRGGLDWRQLSPRDWQQFWPQDSQQDWLQFFSNDGVIQGAKKPVTKIVWQ